MKAKFCLALFVAMGCALTSTAQCGTDPTTGTTIITTANTIVNTYYPGAASVAAGGFTVSVGTRDPNGNATAIGAGDLVLIIQMQSAVIDNSNTNTYGAGVAGPPSSGYSTTNLRVGFYEYNTVASFSGGVITMTYSLANSYYATAFNQATTQNLQTFQVIRVPRDFNLTINAGASITCAPWTGATGGVIADDATNTMTINGSINASGLGFRGGGGESFSGATAGNSNGTTTLVNTDYRFNSPVTNTANLSGGAKGEGIAGTPAYTLTQNATSTTINAVEGYLNGSMGRGAPGNAGGGGTDGGPLAAGGGVNQFNTGGGGGGNGGTGGMGGAGWPGSFTAPVTTYPYGGYGGSPFAQAGVSRLVMGGGGGAGTANNSVSANQYQSSGGTGGGIVILRAKLFAGTGSVLANGATAVGQGAGGDTDAAGGGGAGGTIVAVTRTTGTTGLAGVAASAIGGVGGYMHNYYDHGPGGGGGGGIIITNGTFASTAVTGSSNGFTGSVILAPYSPYINAWGATAGSNGSVITLPKAPVYQNYANLASPCGTLPIMLDAFTGVLNSQTTVLNWQVENAIDFLAFGVEYSTDGNSFDQIGTVPFNQSQSDYQFDHSHVTGAVNFYRLKLIDVDGHFVYSNVIVLRQHLAAKDMSIFPSPADDHIAVSVFAESSQSVTVQIFNINGTKVKEINAVLSAGNNTFSIYELNTLPRGTYTLSTTIDQTHYARKLMISRD